METTKSHNVSVSEACEKNTAPLCFVIRRGEYLTDQTLSRAAERLVETVGIGIWQHILMGMAEFRGGEPTAHRLDDIADTDLAFLLGVHLIERCSGGFRLRVAVDPRCKNSRLVNWR
jgi:hypothetical protein